MQSLLDSSIKLPKADNDFIKIRKEAKSLDELYMATYLRALKDDVFQEYAFKYPPSTPYGWQEAYEIYIGLDQKDKSGAWKNIQSRFSGYLKQSNTIQDENESNKHFLKEMFEFFKSNQMVPQANKCRMALSKHSLIVNL